MVSKTCQRPIEINKNTDVDIDSSDQLSVGSESSIDDQRMSITSSSDLSNDTQSLSSLRSLTDDEMAKVAELRERLGPELLKATPLYDDDQFLLRWVEGWDSKWNEILPRFKKTSQILEALGINELDFEGPDQLNEYVRGLFPASDYFVGGLMGYDKSGNIICMQSIGQIYPKLLVQCGKVSNVFRLSIIEAALTMKLIKKQERKYSRRIGIVIILDLEGLCMDHLFPTSTKVYINLLKILQDMFPDVAKKIFVINAPALFTSAYNLVKPAIAQKTRQRVRVLGHNYAEQLCEELGAENIYPHWGGTKEAKMGKKETGNLRMGGKPLDSLRYLSSTNPFHVDDSLLTKLNVPARSHKTVNIECTQAGQTLRWFFHTNSDIDFHVELHTDDMNENEEEKKQVVPKFRLHTDFVPEFNSVRCHTPGTYVLIFDNSFSTFFSKDIRFYAHCVDENDNQTKLHVMEETKETILLT